MRVLLSVGEASGDALAAAVLPALGPVDVRGVAGPASRAAGARADVRAEDVVGLGIVEAVGAVRRAPAALWRIRALFDRWKPDLVWTVDNPGLNLRIGAMARRRGIPVVHLGSPQVWAWRPGRVRDVARAVDVVLCLLPFEPAWYAGTRVRAEFVGHPAARLVDTPRGEGLVVGLAPGSRPSEIGALWPAFREAAERLRARRSDARFRIALAPGIEDLPGLEHAERCRGIDEAARGARVFLVASGTATLEVAARGVPMVVAYRTHPLTWAVGKRLVRVPWLALPNLLAGRAVAPEHLQRLDPDAIAHDLSRLAGPEGAAAGRELKALAALLEGDRAVPRIAAALRAATAGGPSR